MSVHDGLSTPLFDCLDEAQKAEVNRHIITMRATNQSQSIVISYAQGLVMHVRFDSQEKTFIAEKRKGGRGYPDRETGGKMRMLIQFEE